MLWEYLFENQIETVQQGIIQEVQRVAGGDPRIVVNSVNVYPQQNGMLLEIELTYVNTSNAEILSIFFNQQTRNASYV
jgi:hypothetical protein